MCEIHVSGCQFCIHECVKAQRIPVEVKPAVIWGFWKTYPRSSKLMDGWRNVSPKTSQVMAIRKIETPRMVARGAGECDDRICFALWERASIAFHPRQGSIQRDTETCRLAEWPPDCQPRLRHSQGSSSSFSSRDGKQEVEDEGRGREREICAVYSLWRSARACFAWLAMGSWRPVTNAWLSAPRPSAVCLAWSSDIPK